MQVQSIAWGTAQSSNWLFATSAPESKASHVGSHRAFDVTTNQLLFTLKNGDAGEDLAVDSTGKRLILATSNEEQVFVLETYDIRRNVGKPAQRVILPPLPRYNVEDTNMKSAINAVSFSPDGIYVAVARSDNVTHVYDSRFLGRDILYDFPHGPGTEGTVEDTKYGVVKLDWVEGPGSALSLVTGGADGCVRLWDLKRAKGPNDGTIIAQSDSYVSWFSLGDPHKNEKSIILGDGSGNLVINS
ncbi:hypothetical protein EW026_g4699 [Hermanssonia centrifuga]|uniref:Uncharacterized protein n=1 Tax=Hermanssonia centrifuga TaxID=98765 RepID=A0A4S4KGB4_9APHY|nr:hypothetical protein EW026_g4699 [Hermanssonia centrifuga]